MTLTSWLIIIGIILFIIFIFMLMDNYPEFTYAHWYHYFPDIQFSTLEFYEKVKESLEKREIPDITIEEEKFFEHASILSRKRIYLRVNNGGYKFDICAAPYGTGFFVSWWFGEDTGCLFRLLRFVPIYGAYLRKRMQMKTYYVRDVEASFQEASRLAVLDAIDDITNMHGIRSLSELERKPILGSNRV